jgi:hypothetical protein
MSSDFKYTYQTQKYRWIKLPECFIREDFVSIVELDSVFVIVRLVPEIKGEHGSSEVSHKFETRELAKEWFDKL